MLTNYRVWEDCEFGTVGLAIQLADAIDGKRFWVWASFANAAELLVPSMSAYRLERADQPMSQWPMMGTLQRLESAGAITACQRLAIMAALMQATDRVIEFWAARGREVPSLEEAMRMFGGG